MTALLNCYLCFCIMSLRKPTSLLMALFPLIHIFLLMRLLSLTIKKKKEKKGDKYYIFSSSVLQCSNFSFIFSHIPVVGDIGQKLWGYYSYACCRERHLAWDGEDSEKEGCWFYSIFSYYFFLFAKNVNKQQRSLFMDKFPVRTPGILVESTVPIRYIGGLLVRAYHELTSSDISTHWI